MRTSVLILDEIENVKFWVVSRHAVEIRDHLKKMAKLTDCTVITNCFERPVH